MNSVLTSFNRWDSSDPERAPPPLPINPGTTSPATKSNVSPRVQAVAANFQEKSRDNGTAPYTTNPMPPKPASPEKSLIKGNYHKRMQSSHNVDTRSEFLNYLDNKSPEKSLRASVLDPGPKIQEKVTKKAEEEPSEKRDPERDPPNFLINNRFLSKPILNEPTPPSATMLALQNMQLPSENESSASSSSSTRHRDCASSITGSSETHGGVESLSTQIHSLTDIASNLQREMAQLSRRSKDNATDLVSLKAATNSRDEDIRKSLRELSSNLSSKFLEPEQESKWDYNSFFGSEPLRGRTNFEGSPTPKKSHSRPRMASPNPFTASLDEACASPLPISDGSAYIALLEKVLREMATKDGEERLLEAIDEIKSGQPSDGHDKEASRSVSSMLEEILQLVKENTGSRALIRSKAPASPFEENDDEVRPRSLSLDPDHDLAPDMEIIHERSGPVMERPLEQLREQPREELLEGPLEDQPYRDAMDEMLDILYRVKNSIAEGGGMTNEVKALVRELRGEVLGMGRDIARRFEENEAATSQPLGTEAVAAVVDTSLADLKELLASTVNESRQSSSAFSELRTSLSSAGMYSVVKQALEEIDLSQGQTGPRGVEMQKEEILETVRQGWETYKPEIELQNFGLERDEILECLTEGLKTYQPQHEQAVTYDQVLAAVQAGMQSFGQPQSISKDEIVQTIRETLGGSERSTSRGLGEEQMGSFRDEILQAVTGSVSSQSVLSRGSLDSGLGRDEILSAVSDGIKTHFASPKTAEHSNVTKEDVTDAVNKAFTSQHSAVSTNTQAPVSRDEILRAIAEGLENQSSLTREIELNKDDLMEAITSALNEATASANTGISEQVLARFHDVLGNMKDEFKQYSDGSVKENGHVLDAVKDGIDTVRKEIEGYAANAAQASGKNEIMETVKEGFQLLQADMEKAIADSAFASAPRGNPDTPELLDAMEREFEHLRQTLASSSVRETVSNDKVEILDAINDVTELQKGQPKKEEFANLIKQQLESGPRNDDLVTTIKGEFEAIRESMNTTVARAEPTSDKEEIIGALRQTLEAHREEATRSKEGGESESFYRGQLFDAVNDGVGTIRTDLSKILDKPTESGSNELLEALKEGLHSLKADVEAIRKHQLSTDDAEMSHGMEVALADEAGSARSAPDGAANGPNPFEALRAMIAHLQAKVETIENSPQAPETTNEDSLKKEHMDEVVAGLNELKDSVAGISATRNASPSETAARKEDTDAIETLLRNTKAQLDELALPSADQLPKADQFEALENVVQETKQAVTGLSNRFESEGPTKSEVGTLESLLKDLWIAFDEFKGKGDSKDDENVEKLAKSDLQTVEAMIFEVKTQIDELKIPDVETLPTKTDIEGLSTLVTEKAEHGGLTDKLDEAKAVVEALRDELKSKLDGSSGGLSELKQVLERLAASAENFTTVENLKELTDLINREFERVRGDQDSGKLEREERDASAIVKHDEARAAIIVELGSKIDEKIGEVIAKYDEAQTEMDTKLTATEERDNVNLEAITETKALAEDIKLVIGAMGNSVNETCERISLDTKTFFERVDQSYVRMDTIQCNLQNTQERAMADFERTAAATDRMENQMHKFNPQVLENIQEILSVAGKNFDHSQQSVQDLKTEFSALPSTIIPAIPQPEKYDDTKVHEKLDDLVKHSQDTQVHESLNVLVEKVTKDQVHDKIDQLLGVTTSSNGQIYEKLNELLGHATDGPVHDKLDTLIGHATNTDQSVTQMMKMDEMHKDIMENSRRMNEMFATQHTLLVADHDRKRKEAEEAAVALERRTAEREQVESELAGLRDEKESLLKFINTLNTEKEDLSAQNAKMSKDLSGLETALELRTEEMHVMEERADGLEKRILEGVLDHARSVLLSRPKGVQRSNSKRNRGSRARGPSASGTAAAKEARGIINNGIGMALKKRSSTSAQAGSNGQSNSKERRIFSSSHVTGNRGPGERQSSTGSGLANLKRSQSVKSNMSQRKSSWGGRSSMANKENEPFPEEDEQRSGDESDTGTERRTSYGAFDRRVSGTSKGQESLADDDEGQDFSDTEIDGLPHDGDVDPETKLVLYKKHRSHPSGNDSGLGTDVASAAE